MVMARHGQTHFNVNEIWAGWHNTSLTDFGSEQAVNLGRILNYNKFYPDVVMTTRLERAEKSTEYILHTMKHSYVDVVKKDELLELHAGALTGSKKTSENKKFLKEWNERPPAMEEDHTYHPLNNGGTIGMPLNGCGGESMADVAQRTKPIFEEVAQQYIKKGLNVLIVGHSNSLSAFISNLTGEQKKYSIKNAEPLEVILKVENDQPVFFGISKMAAVPGFSVEVPKALALVSQSKEAQV